MKRKPIKLVEPVRGVRLVHPYYDKKGRFKMCVTRRACLCTCKAYIVEWATE